MFDLHHNRAGEVDLASIVFIRALGLAIDVLRASECPFLYVLVRVSCKRGLPGIDGVFEADF